MAERNLFERLGEAMSANRGNAGENARDEAPLGGTRAEANQRLQVGLTGLFAMIFMIGVASAIGGQADIAEEAAVPDAAPTTEPTAAPPQRDPLADAGVVPDIPSQPEAQASEDSQENSKENIVPDIEGTVPVPDMAPTEPDVRGNER